MAYDQHSGEQAYAQHDEPVFLAGVFLVIELDSMIIEEYGLSFGKRNTVFLLVRSILPWIPLELDHADNVFTKYAGVKPVSRGHVRLTLFTPAPGSFRSMQA